MFMSAVEPLVWSNAVLMLCNVQGLCQREDFGLSLFLSAILLQLYYQYSVLHDFGNISN